MIRKTIALIALILVTACSAPNVPAKDCPREGGIGGTGDCPNEQGTFYRDGARTHARSIVSKSLIAPTGGFANACPHFPGGTTAMSRDRVALI
ncbi:MAG: hypothetical protein ABJH45_26710 [Paracoccaceae bacterium]